MRFLRSLRKTIAAALAFTTLTVPLTGCSRTATTGGLSGKGALGDFLVGGLYGGVLGGFICPGKPLPEGAIVLELPRVNDERLLVEAVGMDALRYYVHARIATEKLSRMNRNNSKPEEYRKLELCADFILWLIPGRDDRFFQKKKGAIPHEKNLSGTLCPDGSRRPRVGEGRLYYVGGGGREPSPHLRH